MGDNTNLSYALGIGGVILSLWGPVPEQFRVPAAILVLVFVVLSAVGNTEKDVDALRRENRKVLERLSIHEQLVEMKADIKSLKRRR